MAEGYIKHLSAILRKDAEVAAEKDEHYGASWLNYGGLSAFFATVRKWDRIIVQLKKVGMDVFKAYEVDTRQEGFMDDVRDLRRYLALWEARAMELGLVPEERGDWPRTLPAQGQDTPALDGLEMAWNIIANASDGAWEKQTPEWRRAAEGFRELYFGVLKNSSLAEKNRQLEASQIKPACDRCHSTTWKWRQPNKGYCADCQTEQERIEANQK